MRWLIGAPAAGAVREAATGTRRGGAVAWGLVGALLVGGVSQTLLWRWGLGGLATVTGSQFTWVLLAFGVARARAGGRVLPGTAAGGVTGLALITSYYVMQWVVDGRHSALAQLAKTGGAAWTVSAIGGGAVIGLFGGLASMDARARPTAKALGLVTPAAIVIAGPALWLLAGGGRLEAARLAPAAAVFALAGAALVLYAVRACGARAAGRAVVMSIGSGVVALAGLLWLQTHGGLYPTF